MSDVGREALDSKLDVACKHIRFIGLICDARTVIAIIVSHALIANPSSLGQSIPSGPYKNLDKNGAQDEQSFVSTVSFLP
jgi:hypothetical protein